MERPYTVRVLNGETIQVESNSAANAVRQAEHLLGIALALAGLRPDGVILVHLLPEERPQPLEAWGCDMGPITAP